MKKWVFSAVLFLLFSSVLWAQEEPPKVRISLIANQKSIQPGVPFTIGILLKIDKGWHTYYKEPGDAGEAPEFIWKVPRDFKVGEVEFPQPLELVEPGNLRVNGYHDEVLLWAKVTPPSFVTTSLASFQVEARWLVCEKLCIPETGKASLTLPVMMIPPEPDNRELFKRYQETSSNSASSAPQPNSIWKFLVFAFVGGLILNVMPCVLPVISIKVLSFVRMAQESKTRVFFLGLAFVAGILASFLTLALLVIALKSFGQEIGWGFQFQFPGFVIALTAICFALGLSLAGVYELTLAVPQKGMELARREGWGGAFFQGVLATVLATPCTAPFLGVALGFAFSRSPAVLLTVFLTMGAGMACPYLILTSNPAWLRLIPKPGAWMENVKQLMAFLLFGTCVWLLWVLGRQVGVEGLVWTLAFLVVLGLAAWIYGKVQGKTALKRLGWLAALLGVLLWSGTYFIRPIFYLAAPEQEVGKKEGGIYWKKYNPLELQSLLADGKKVFLDFTADWCLTCKANEKLVLSQPDVAAKFAELGVVAVKLDWTDQDKEVSRLLKSFGRYGVPLYVYYPQGNDQPPKILPEVLTKKILLDALK